MSAAVLWAQTGTVRLDNELAGLGVNDGPRVVPSNVAGKHRVRTFAALTATN